MNQNGSTAILVAGMHRSGTSVLTGALGLMGVTLGDRLLAPGPDNPKGYWEHQDVVAVHEELLTALDRRWDDVRPLPDGWQDSEATHVAAERIEALIARDFLGTPLWAVKDPRMCRFLPIWLRAVERCGIRPVVLFMARSPSEVAASISARNNWAAPVGELLWLRHVLEAEASSRDVPRFAVAYDDLLRDPAATITHALEVLGVSPVGTDGQRLSAVQQLVDPRDRHQREGENGVELAPPFTAVARTAYTALLSVTHGDDGWRVLADCFMQLDELWRESGAAVDAIADMAQQFARREATARREALEISSKLNAQIQWSEEAVAIRTALREEHQVALESIIGAREQLAARVQDANMQAQREQAEAQRATAEREQLADRLESVLAQIERERTESAAAREQLVGELKSTAAQAERERAERAAADAMAEEQLARERAESAAAREQLVGELKSATAQAERERAERAAADAMAEEQLARERVESATAREQLVGELKSTTAQAERERAEWATMRKRLVADLEAMAKQAERERAEHIAALAQLSNQCQAKSTEADVARDIVDRLNGELAMMRDSWSWRMTKPLRAIRRLARRMPSAEGGKRKT